jgi:hypothetical protein
MLKKQNTFQYTRYHRLSRVHKNKRKRLRKVTSFMESVVLGVAVKFSIDLINAVVHFLTSLIY